MTRPVLPAVLLTLVLAAALRAEPPKLLATEEADAAADPGSVILPIPPEATPEQMAEFQEVIDETRRNDVSVTDQNALLYRGLMLIQDEEYEEASAFLEEALRRDPSLQAGWEGLGWTYIKLDQLDRAVRLWEYFRRLMPDEALPHALLAQAAILQSHWEEADKSFEEALRINPGQYDIRFWYAQNLMRLGRAEDAEKCFRELFNENRDRLDVAMNLATLLTQRLAYDEAVDIYRRVNEELPGNIKFMLEQALLEVRVGELRTADQLCLDVLEEDPGNSQAMLLRADIAEISGQQDIEPFLDIIKETGDPITRASLRVRLANRCHLANNRRPGQYRTGFILGLLREAIDEAPTNLEYQMLYAERLLEAKRHEECRNWAVHILETENRHHSRAKMLLFELAMRDERYDDALQILVDRYSVFDTTDPMFHYYKARLCTAKGEFTDALREIDEMEAAAQQGAVFTLLYHGLTESDWTPAPSVRRLHEHIMALQREGFTLVSPADIPQLVGLSKGESRVNATLRPEVPATARFLDSIRYGLTGTRKFPAPMNPDESESRPKKFFVITFDDDHRSALVLGTSVAQEFGVPFGIFTPTRPEKEYVPSRAGWQELRDAAASGAWLIGSQLHSANVKLPVDREGIDIRAPLPNRVWLPEKNRLESMNEWDRRMRDEFRRSREILAQEMGGEDSPVPMVAYPYGDIGQIDCCNLSVLRNPSRSILSEAAREYTIGFVPSPYGWTVAGDDLLLCRRYEPHWSDEGTDVIRHAYEAHPTFIARRMRAEIAMMTNRPNLANRMLELLRRDGYPEDLCRAMENQLRAQFRNKPLHDVRPLLAVSTEEEDDSTQKTSEARDPEPFPSNAEEEEESPENLVKAINPEAQEALSGEESAVVDRSNTAGLAETTPDPLVYLSHPYLGVEAAHSKANDQIETYGFGVRAGLDLNRNTTFSLRYYDYWMKQTVRPRWNAIVVTNVPYGKSRYTFKSKTESYVATLPHRTGTGAVLAFSFGHAERSPTGRHPDYTDINLQDRLNSKAFVQPKDDEIFLYSLGARWHPRDNLELTFLYDHGYVDSAVKFLAYHSAGAGADWRPADDWLMRAAARYWAYDDDNAMYSARFESYWETNPDLGVWLGVQCSTATTSEPCDFYWTPYWDERIMGVLRYLQHWEGYTFRLDLLGGFHRARGRPDRAYRITEKVEKVVYTEGVANTVVEEEEGTYIMEDQSSSWSVTWGVTCSYEKTLNNYFDLVLEGSVFALRDYIDHSIMAYLRLHF